MTAPDPRALLDALDETHAKATPGEWVQHPSDGNYVIGDVSDDGGSYFDVADTYSFRSEKSAADAAAIVAAHNALPALTAAIRAALDLADELDVTFAGSSIQRTLRERVTAALTEVVETVTEVAG